MVIVLANQEAVTPVGKPVGVPIPVAPVVVCVIDGKIVLIDEIHTPDSSRYFYADGYQGRQDKGEEQKQLSKEFVRRWLIENCFQGKDGQQIPNMTDEYIETVSERYIELYENILGEKFIKADISNINERIEKNVLNFLSK